jgi:hypothetical protein
VSSPATAQPSWEAMNGAYLATGLAWLRERLAPDAPDPDAAGAWWESPPLDGSSPPLGDAEVAPALELLGDRLGLSRFERLVLLLVAATELDPGIASLCAQARGSAGAGYPTLALALALLPQPAWDVVSPQRPLRYWRLLELDEPRAGALTATRLRIDERITSFIKGLNILDDRLDHLIKPVADELTGPLPVSHQGTLEQIVLALTEESRDERPPVIELVGADPAVRRGLATRAAHAVGQELYELAPERVPVGAAELGDLTRLWERETLLLPVLLYVDVAQIRSEETGGVTALVEDVRSRVLLGCREPWALDRRRLRVVDTARPTAEEQEGLWHDLLGADDGAPARLAAEFDLNQTVIGDIARQVQHSGRGPAGLWSACRSHARPRLDTLARRVEPTASWDDLVLPAPELELLHHIVDQVRGRSKVLRSWGLADRIKRGSAITALFAGASGTGKTMAAEVIGNELGLDMYRIDLAGVVSKYIGETERNLRRVFDAAEEGGALLLFDEADALFGKRSEVKDSHDRYANIEVSYLLARLEDYRGIAILASNQRHAIDDAFLRRLRFVVAFPFPAPAERALLWARAFPPRAPVAALDVARLAQLAASGGMIRNIALNAAFCAAGRGGSVTMDLVLEMARVEFRKLELPVNDAEFRLEAAA